MKKQKIALAAIGIAGLILMGTALFSVAGGGNSMSKGYGNRLTTMGLTTGTGNLQTMEYVTSPGMSYSECFSGNEMTDGWQTNNHTHIGRGGNRGGMMGHHRNSPLETPFMGTNYLNTTRLEGVLEYNENNYIVDTTILYLGNELFLENLAKSDYDRDGTYEYIWQELEGLLDTVVVVNGVLENNTLYVTHINGIWLRTPTLVEITEIQGELTYDNETGSYFVDDTEIITQRIGYCRSDIDGDGSLEPFWDELNGLLGETITVDGTLIDAGLVIEHINGIWVK